jgi:hypothetical protein
MYQSLKTTRPQSELMSKLREEMVRLKRSIKALKDGVLLLRSRSFIT